VPHETSLIATIAVGLAFGLAGGFVAVRLGFPPVVGYLLAGIAVGPFTPGFVADAKLAPQLAEIGVILLMFGVGMHFSVRELLEARTVAVPGALVQIAVATALGAGVAVLWGWSLRAGLVFGLALSVASTVVLLRSLEARGRLYSDDGRIAVGWLIVEDLVMVLAIVLLPVLAGSAVEGDLWAVLGRTLGKVALFAALMLAVGVRVFPWLLARVEDTGSRELFTLAVVALALGVAFASARWFGVSFALGAFFAGAMIHQSDLHQRAAADLQPLQDAFAVLFFVGVGMLFDPAILVEQPIRVLAVVAIIVVGKSLAAGHRARLRRRSAPRSASPPPSPRSASSHSFSPRWVPGSVLPPEGQSLIVAGALISITLNSFLFLGIEKWGFTHGAAATSP
jgi:CPA2 family monovalent cation:H+ antiporter-2